MSDPSAVLRPALKDWLRADAGVIAAFGPNPLLVFAKLPPKNQPTPYVFLAGFQVEDDIAECLDATIVEVQIDVWSLTSPPGFEEAETIADAVKASFFRIQDGDSPAFTLDGYRVVAVQPLATDYLTQADGKTVHAVIRVALSIDPT